MANSSRLAYQVLAQQSVLLHGAQCCTLTGGQLLFLCLKFLFNCSNLNFGLANAATIFGASARRMESFFNRKLLCNVTKGGKIRAVLYDSGWRCLYEL